MVSNGGSEKQQNNRTHAVLRFSILFWDSVVNE